MSKKTNRLKSCTPCSNVLFSPAVNFPTGTYPWSAVSADFNNDGNLDLAISNALSHSISIFLGYGNGLFQGNITIDNFPGVVSLLGIVAADFNEDGNMDLAVVNTQIDNIFILLGNGNGTFSNPVPYQVNGANSVAITAKDFNNDGHIDLAVTNSNSSSVSVIYGNGNGTFSGSKDFPANDFPFGITSADFNNDGNMDLAIINTSFDATGTVSILLGDGTGNFSTPTTFSVGNSPSDVVAADFNGDGNIDLAVTNGGDDNASILLGNGNGTFLSPVNFPTGITPQGITFADFNCDGKIDLAISNNTSNNASILLGNGDGTFSSPINFDAQSSPTGITTGDFNKDGKIDLAVPNYLSDSVSVLLNDSTPLPLRGILFS